MNIKELEEQEDAERFASETFNLWNYAFITRERAIKEFHRHGYSNHPQARWAEWRIWQRLRMDSKNDN